MLEQELTERLREVDVDLAGLAFEKASLELTLDKIRRWRTALVAIRSSHFLEALRSAKTPGEFQWTEHLP